MTDKNQVPTKILNNFCWIMSTFTFPAHFNVRKYLHCHRKIFVLIRAHLEKTTFIMELVLASKMKMKLSIINIISGFLSSSQCRQMAKFFKIWLITLHIFTTGSLLLLPSLDVEAVGGRQV